MILAETPLLAKKHKEAENMLMPDEAVAETGTTVTALQS